MKSTFVAVAAAAIVGSASAHVAHRHAHELFQAKRDNGTELEVCVPTCTTLYTTITGDIIWQPTPDAPALTTASATITPVSTPAVVPTPIAKTIDTPGTYTFPATTLTVTATTTVCGASTTEVPAGTHTLGGVTTVVVNQTTVVCPYATVKTESGGIKTSVIEMTTYVCPSAGTYTIAPITTTVSANENVTVPIVTSYAPGVYTAPALTTVVETQTVIYCPFASSTEASALPTATPSTSSAPVAKVVSPETSSAPAIVASVSIPIPDVVISASIAIPTIASVVNPFSSVVASSSSVAPSATSAVTLGGSGNQWAMTYTPYTSGGECKTAFDVLDDVASIAAAGFTTLRVYSTDCDTLPSVGAAAEVHGLKMIVGIFIGEVGCDNGSPHVADQLSALESWAKWELVELVSVGNEAMFNGYCTPAQLAELIAHTKSTLGAVGYSGSYTTTDVVAAWQETEVSSVICPVIDIVSANIHPYFNADITPAEAGDFVKSQLAIVEAACGLEGLVLETGYPHSGVCNGSNCPSVENQATAIASIQAAMGSKVAFFSMFDDLWKAPGACECEQSWGCGTLFGVTQ